MSDTAGLLWAIGLAVILTLLGALAIYWSIKR